MASAKFKHSPTFFSLIVAIFLITTNLHAQELKRIPRLIQEAKSQKGAFAKVDVFENQITKHSDVKSLKDQPIDGVVLTLKDMSAIDFKSAAYKHMEFRIPQENGVYIDLELIRNDKSFANTIIKNQDGVVLDMEIGTHYYGMIKGDNESLCAISFYDGKLSGFVSDAFQSKFFSDENLADNQLLFHLDFSNPEPFQCQTESNNFTPLPQANHKSLSSGVLNKCIDVFVEVDSDIYAEEGINTAEFICELYNRSFTIYQEQIGISMTISEIEIIESDVDSPYSNIDYSAEDNQPLFDLIDNFTTKYADTYFNGDIAQLITARIFGGKAGNINLSTEICGYFDDLKMSVAGIGSAGDNTYVPESYRIYMITHEIGHLLGAHHTHTWDSNGDGESFPWERIDNCGLILEDSTLTPSIPSEFAPCGSIMSYCPLIEPCLGTSSFTTAFHEQVIERIQLIVGSLDCLECDACDSSDEEPNDTSNEALNVFANCGVNAQLQSYEACISSDEDVDWYTFTTTSSGQINVRLRDVTDFRDYALELYYVNVVDGNEELQLLPERLTFNSTPDENDWIQYNNVDNNPRQYYLSISNVGLNLSGRYTIELDWKCTSTPSDPLNITANPPALCDTGDVGIEIQSAHDNFVYLDVTNNYNLLCAGCGPSVIIENTEPGTTIMAVTASLDGCSISSGTVTIADSGGLEIDLQVSDSQVYAGETVQCFAYGADSFNWYLNDVLQSGVNNWNPSFTIYDNTLIAATTTDASACSDAVFIEVIDDGGNGGCRYTDSLALVALYESTDGANWTTTWDLLQPIHTWYGVRLNEDGCVYCLDMDNPFNCAFPQYFGTGGNNLSGNIPPELGNLSNLERLSLYNNQLSGSIPPELGNLSNLERLFLYKNQLSGNIPSELGNLGNLRDLTLSNNQLSGSIPSELGNLSNLQYLALSNNQLSGSMPSELGNLNNLFQLSLMYNQLSGSIPSELGNLDNLYRLRIAYNQLGGCFDENLINLCDQLSYSIITQGNNFNISWEDFCSTGVCITVPPSGCRYTDSLALVALYESTNGANWTTTWDLLQPMDTWYGITLNNEGCVTEVEIPDNQLIGNLPPELGNLSTLEILNLPKNQLSGNIPPEFGNLNNMTHLHIWNNQFNGTIPNELGYLTNMVSLRLDENQFSGNIPTELGNLSNLYNLSLHNNQLTGSIPYELGNLSNLIFLILYDNQLSGNIPSELGSLSNLHNLDIHNNQLSGSIPYELGSLNNLSYFRLDNNNLSGSIPVEFGNLSTVKLLALSYNQLVGDIPSELGSLSNLEYLHLSYNQLSGSIPTEFGNLGNLIKLYLYGNELSGGIPFELGSLINLEYLFLGRNQLSGSIPLEFGSLSDLKYLILNENQLSGSIPSELEYLGNLMELILANNQLSGNIPPELENLSNLEVLNLSGNQLSGSIPSELGSLNNLEELHLSSNQLSGCYDENLISLCNQLSNQSISNGNNFDVSWEDFCSTGAGLCLPEPPPGCRHPDSLALVALYQSTNGANWTTPWDLTQPMTNWHGITLNEEGCVTEINLNSNQLYGNIPPELGNLDSLTQLHLYDNQLNGSLPSELGNLSELTFVTLKSNQLTGNIPPELGNLANLTFLSISKNSLTGDIPTELGNLNNLEELYLYENNLSGNLPTALGSLSNLTVLYLYENNFNSSIPPEFGNLNNLNRLNLYGNSLSGNIPSELGNLSNLTELGLSSNLLGGNIPPELGNLSALTFLNLSNMEYSFLHGSQLTGNIPPELGNLSNLTFLSLSGNQLDGSIPSEIGNLSNLTDLYLYNNELNGCYDENLTNLCSQLSDYNISDYNNFNDSWDNFCSTGAGMCSPPSVCRSLDSLALVALYENADGANWTNPWQLDQSMDNWYGITLNEEGCVTEINLNNNQLYGNIPPELGNLSNLTQLYLYDNQLNGNIPSELGNLSNLTQLHLYDNQLNGTIPSELGSLSNLTVLALSSNQLIGNIPSELGNLSNLTSLNLYDNQLNGNIPIELGSLSNLTALVLSDNHFSGNIPSELGNLNNLTHLYLSNNQLSGCYDENLLNLCQFSNSNISDGNNLNMPWEDFCATGTCTSQPVGCRYTDSLALVALYNSTNGPNWTTTWDLSQPIDAWHGVTLNADNCVTQLMLSNNNLQGTIPPEIGNLSQLTDLEMRYNQLSGNIPIDITNLNNLSVLDLHYNNLAGNILPEIGNLAYLSRLDLSYNNFTGSIPLQIGNLDNLINLNLSANSLVGSIPTVLSNLQYLEYISLSENDLTGSIPPEFGNLKNLVGISMYQNQLTGNIPLEIFSLDKLEYINLHGNQLSGNLPPEIENLVNLRGIYLGYNDLDGNLPPEIGNLTELSVLWIDANNLEGNIPSEVWNLTNLTQIRLHNNNLTGNIPPEIGNLTKMNYLYLNGNQFTGHIPSEIGNLNKIRYLSLYSNDFTGSIPPEIGNLIDLEGLYLSSNQLSGCYDANLINISIGTNPSISNGNNFDVPWEDFTQSGVGVCNIPFPNCRQSDSLILVTLYNTTDGANWRNTWDLTQPLDTWHGVTLNVFGCVDSLNLTYNYLRNSIPTELGSLGSLRALDLSRNYLSGSIPAELGSLTNLLALELHLNYLLNGNIPPEIGNLNNLIYLNLANNQLSGGIPVELGNLNSLVELYLYKNQLTGNIPSLLENLIYLEELQLSDNQLTGSIPLELGNLNKLEHLSLFNNLLSGSIPSELGKLDELKSLNLQDNQLTGSIPSELGNLYDLWYLSLSDNQLTGSIPLELGNFRNLWRLLLYNNQLSGCYNENLMNLCNQLYAYNTDNGTNENISDGNNFDTPWENFCATGAGTCTNIQFDVKIILEGPYDPTQSKMTTILNTERGLLPGQTPSSELAAPTPAGQPYNLPSWNYTGREGANFSDADYLPTVVDWVLISLRTGVDKADEVARVAALLHEDACIETLDGHPLATSHQGPFYIVIEHRNHMGIMSPTPVTVENGVLQHDFTAQDSYTALGVGAGQKAIFGMYQMFAGDYDQVSDEFSYDITGGDKIIWDESNGQFNIYLPADFNLDGDVNGSDKIPWEVNNGTSSRVQK